MRVNVLRIRSFTSYAGTYPLAPLFEQELNVLYDGKCALCMAEINFLKRKDNGQDTPRLRFTDIEAPSYDPACPSNGGVDYETGLTAIHAVTKEGALLRGVPVFAAAYHHVGLGWLFTFTKVR